MSQFPRRESPPAFDHHEKYRPFLRRDFHFVCAYCERPELFLGGEEFFEIDHFRPVGKFPERKVHYPNLYYACGKCNRHKGSTWPSEDLMGQGFQFADPCEVDMYVRHLDETQSGGLNARTNVGRYTCLHIRLNRPELLAWRQERRKVGAEIRTLQSLRESLALGLRRSSEFRLREDLSRQVAVLDSTIARLRGQFSL